VTAYFAVIHGYAENPEARTNLLERVLYQAVRSAIFAKDVGAATNALATIQRWYPEGNLMQRSVLLGGIEMSRHDPIEARQMYSDFIKQFPGAELLPDVQLALARTYEQQEEWTNAIAQYDEWIGRYTNHSGLARAEYSRAWANAQAGRSTNAFALFSTFVNRFPATALTPHAHWWLGDYYLQQGQLEDAERSYKTISQSTNWPASAITYRAWMMAGRVAFRRSGKQAAQYFTDLWNNTNCPAEIRAQALFAYGDTLMATEPAETNKLANYDEAIRVFSRISEMYPTNRIGALAWGQKAACLLQWAQVSGQYDAASNAFRQVIDSPGADGRARAIAKVGLASALENQAQKASSATEKAELIKSAMNHCLDVLFNSGDVWRGGEEADPFWVRKAGLEAARYAEAQNQWEQARKIYGRLQELMPVLRARMEKNAARAYEQEQLMKTKPAQPALAEKK
jgi:TolA-binding protein